MLIYDLHRKDNRLSGSAVLTSEKEQQSIQGTCLDILENGLQLLHLMSQHDPEFMSRHVTVQHNYVLLICGMSQSVKNLPTEKRESVCEYKKTLYFSLNRSYTLICAFIFSII